MNFEELTPELQEKARECKTAEDILALAKEEGYELSDAELEGVSGGWGCSCNGHQEVVPIINCGADCDPYDSPIVGG